MTLSISMPRSIRARLTILYVGMLAFVLTIYLVVVFIFQYGLLTSQVYHDEMQDMETVEGLLYFDAQGQLHLRDEYLSHPQSHLLIDRLMEVRDLSGNMLYRSATLAGMPLEPAHPLQNEGVGAFNFNEHMTRLADGSHVLMISHRHPVQDRLVLIRLGYSLALIKARMERFLLALLLALPVALLAAGLAGYSFVRRALSPLDSMTLRAEQITATNLHGRLTNEGEPDELGRMARVLNSLLSRLERSFAQLQRFTADAAHELKTPLTSMRVVGESALAGNHPQDSYREAIGSMLEEAARLNQTVEGLLLISRAEAGQLTLEVREFPIEDLVDEIVSLLDVVIEERHVKIVRQQDRSVQTSVLADRTLLRTCVLNVLHNALKFSPPGSAIEIRSENIKHGGNAYVRLSIRDHGPGIAAADQQRVFERFYRVRDVRESSAEGAGLGLSIARLAIESNHGSIYFDPAVSNGSLCHIEIMARQHVDPF